ncbi:unnamed protein product [Paramecium sonneborni]|uniref:Uncharacterized protein n=1 Tax=Paramecium sonneborni TaxID=65129 RepID=A0A8S1QSV2_9CILI|nr:unnamed protein product [Paramecium sonneborni]
MLQKNDQKIIKLKILNYSYDLSHIIQVSDYQLEFLKINFSKIKLILFQKEKQN